MPMLRVVEKRRKPSGYQKADPLQVKKDFKPPSRFSPFKRDKKNQPQTLFFAFLSFYFPRLFANPWPTLLPCLWWPCIAKNLSEASRGFQPLRSMRDTSHKRKARPLGSRAGSLHWTDDGWDWLARTVRAWEWFSGEACSSGSGVIQEAMLARAVGSWAVLRGLERGVVCRCVHLHGDEAADCYQGLDVK